MMVVKKIACNFVKCLVLSLLVVLPTWGNADVLFVVPIQDDKYSTHLAGIYRHYWFNQGEIFNPLVSNALAEWGKTSGETIMQCMTGQETANHLLLLSPSIFYNPLQGIYYATVAAKVYSANGVLETSYSAEAQHLSNIPINNNFPVHVKVAYRLALQKLIQKLHFHTATIISTPPIACGALSGIERAKIRVE